MEKKDMLTELQSCLLDMLKWFHNFCVSNKLRYYALGGTMLGAVRHKGFIPWDDDIDVGMPRKDYNKLIKMIGDREFEGFYLETPFSRSFNYRYPYCKLYNVNTILVEHTWPLLRRGIFIDVFPLDGLGDSKEEAENRWKSIDSSSKYIWCRTCAVRKGRSPYKNAAIVAAHLIPNFLSNDKNILSKMDKLCQERDFDSVSIGGNVFGNWGLKEVMQTSIMGEPQMYAFENQTIYGAYDFEAYLTNLYGDWRQLPPVEKRVTHHDFIELDLHTPYI